MSPDASTPDKPRRTSTLRPKRLFPRITSFGFKSKRLPLIRYTMGTPLDGAGRSAIRTSGLIALALFVFSACSRVETVSTEQARAMIESGGVIVVDIRDPKKFADGHIKGAINAEYHPKTFARDTEQIDKNAAIILYCSMGLKTKMAARELERRGFTRIYAMEGGIEAWMNAGFPVSGR